MKIVFFDFNNKVITALQKENDKYNNEKYDIIFENKSLLEIQEKYITDTNSVILVSPANSFGSMGGGIDYYINKYTFPKIQKLVRNEIEKLDYTYNKSCYFDRKQWKDKKYLPVGKSLLIKHNNHYLAVVPTMEYPKKINNTNNVYKATKSLMKNIKDYQVDYLLIPGLGTGIGNLDYEIMAKQMLKALYKYLSL
jgi:O-acetyl-ADP-ribose deacetylase (regulator of RNase III)